MTTTKYICLCSPILVCPFFIPVCAALPVYQYNITTLSSSSSEALKKQAQETPIVIITAEKWPGTSGNFSLLKDGLHKLENTF